MTNTEQTTRPTLPTMSLNYQDGCFVNSMTGEKLEEIQGVILAKRRGRVLWPSSLNPDPRPECVDGSKYGPCSECRYAQWGRNGEPPECSEELTLLMWQGDEHQVVEVTARRSQVRIIEQWLGMKAMLDGRLHDQAVTVRMKPEDGLHRLILLPGAFLQGAEKTRLEELAGRMASLGGFEVL